MLSFDAFNSFNWSGPKWTVMWIETRLDCRLWSYYCDLRKAMARLHTLVGPESSWPQGMHSDASKGPDLIVVGPRFTTNNYHTWDPLGINRSRFASVPLVVVQNKLFDCVHGESCGGPPEVKLEWARQVGAAAAFTWLTRHHEFTQRSGVLHHWMPFAADVDQYGQYADGALARKQSFDVGFSGTNDASKYPLRAAVLKATWRYAQQFGWRSALGSWSHAHVGNYSKMTRQDYVRRIAATKIWLATTGPNDLVGTRYFEVLASGTTLVLCNRAHGRANGPWIYDGLLEDGVHVATFATMDDLREKLQYYLTHEDARRRIVRAARELAVRLHSWDARARFISAVAQRAIEAHPPSTPWYVPPPRSPSEAVSGASHYLGCFAEPRSRANAGTAPDVDDTTWKPQDATHAGPYTGGFNVSDCERRCTARSNAAQPSHFALVCGGFCKGGDVHNRARCLCGSATAWRGVEGSPIRASKCESTCSLHDARACGAASAMAVYAYR